MPDRAAPSSHRASRRRRSPRPRAYAVAHDRHDLAAGARASPRDVPADLGDSLLNIWVLAWVGGQVLRRVGAATSAFARSLARQHLRSRRRSASPSPSTSRRRWCRACRSTWRPATSVLAYNLRLPGDVRALGPRHVPARARAHRQRAAPRSSPASSTRSAPYRSRQFPHLQVLSSQWMPFALLGFRRLLRHAARWRRWPAARGVRRAEPVVRLLPAVLRAGPGRVRRRGRWPAGGCWRDWRACGGAGGRPARPSLLATLPFLLPVPRGARALRRQPGRSARSLGFSADVYAYLTRAVQLAPLGRRG